MAVDALTLARLLHRVSVALALGGLATLPVVASRVHRAGDSRFATYGLDVLARIERWIVLPATAGVVAFGLAMVEGPIAVYDFKAPTAGWLHVGAGLWTLLAFALYAMYQLRKRLHEEAEQGATGGDTVDTLWRYWHAAWAVAALAIVGGIAVMAFRLGA